MIFHAFQITLDHFYRGKVIVKQHRSGYRFSIDAPLLADFLPHAPLAEALEIGTGSGIISLLAQYHGKFKFIRALEIQPRLCRLAKQNVRLNHMGGKIRVIHGDFSKVYARHRGIQIVFSNPPYRKTTGGHLSPNREIRLAKTETALDLETVVMKSATVIHHDGCLCLILPADRRDELMRLCEAAGLFITRWRDIQSFADGKPERFLVQLSAKQRDTARMKPLVLFIKPGEYTSEAEKILSGNRHAD